MHSTRGLLAVVVVAVLGAAVLLGRSGSAAREAGPEKAAAEGPAPRMVEAARSLLSGLAEERRAKASFSFDDPYRTEWHYYPITPLPRKGAVLKEMTPKEKELVKGLLRSGTSEAGYKTALGVISLENILRDIENTEWARRYRDSDLYYVCVFGTPALTGRWGWRIEGHHLSLNYVLEDGKVVATTPIAFGANPQEVMAGPSKGLRVLAREEDLARRLYTSFDAAARKKATIADTAPFDVLSEVKAQPKPLPLEGLAYADMNDQQKGQLEELLRVHAGRQPQAVADELIGDVKAAGLERVRFGWAGPAQPGEPHYYRIQGPTFVVEYCNAQHNANHSHLVWRSYSGDFGIPAE